jgi:tRNA1(Val) A37 N6-methylase TrmN6
MTDIFTHAVILQQIHQYLKDGCSVLDIGTGHGYLPFVLGQLRTRMKIVGLDINANAIEMCNQIREKVKCYSDVSF